MRRKTYWVYLNGEYIADYRTLRGCLDFIERRKLEYNYDNDLGIIDNEGNEYHPYTGEMYMDNTLKESKRINEWNLWDGDRRSSSAPRQTRLIDVADKMRREQMLGRRDRYKNDPEYHEHIKRLEDELRRTDDPQHAEYLERRISKLRSLSEGVTNNAKLYVITATCDPYNARRHYYNQEVLKYNGTTPVYWIQDDNYGDGYTIDEAMRILDSYANDMNDDVVYIDDDYIQEEKRYFREEDMDYDTSWYEGEGWYENNYLVYKHGDMSLRDDVMCYEIEALEDVEVYESNKTSRTSRAINEMARKRRVRVE